ncbi:MAG: TlpA family protein disulfide reductase [Alphaproteobacteria bacterium]|jgi:thiol-disulfide isomerase/thioredoxin|nr:TlpA family protein disulfide reductase [Alphaproteobacteria bacterium]
MSFRRIIAALALIAATTLMAAPGHTTEALKALDVRADGSRIVNLIVHPEPRTAPNITFFDAAGKTLTLEDFRGQYTAVHFWATWCFPCRGEMPTVDHLQGEVGAEKITILPLSLDRHGPAQVTEFYGEFGIQHMPVYIDEGMDSARAMRVNGIPATIFVDPQGREVARVLGDRDWSTPEVIALVKGIVNQAKQ